MNEDILLAVFGTRKLAFADLPHLVIAEPTGAILKRWRLLTGASLGIWGLGAHFSSASADEPDSEHVPLATWACERNQQALFDTIVRCPSEAGKEIIDCRLDEELVRAYLGDKLATLGLREQCYALAYRSRPGHYAIIAESVAAPPRFWLLLRRDMLKHNLRATGRSNDVIKYCWRRQSRGAARTSEIKRHCAVERSATGAPLGRGGFR